MNKHGIVTKISKHDFETTYNRLKDAIVNNPNLNLLFELDHKQNAQSVDLDLRPTRILFFGNPKLGTPLMDASETTGIDLPQKMFVTQVEGGVVKLMYNDPIYLQERHSIQGKDEVLAKISGALDKISEKVVSK